jgi:uncharacterized protein (TIGR02996 family)
MARALTDMEQAFRRDICENPDDLGLRLIYADWLEEQGRTEEAHFIRIPFLDATPQSKLGRQARQLLSGLVPFTCRLWLYRASAPGVQQQVLRGRDITWGEHDLHWLPSRSPEIYYLVRYGFVSAIACGRSWFFAQAKTLFLSHPITDVRLRGVWPDYFARPLSAGHVPTDWRSWVRGTCRTVPHASHKLPREWFDLLPGPERRAYDAAWKHFETAYDAYRALSGACVAWGRGQAGLPAWTPPAQPDPAQTLEGNPL